MDLDQDLGRSDRGPIRPAIELAHRAYAFTAGAPDHHLRPDRRARRGQSHAAAIAAAAGRTGVLLTLSHSVIDEVRRRALVRLDVRGTPALELWHASTLGLGRALPAALALQRFASTPDATHAISTGRAGTVSTRVRPG